MQTYRPNKWIDEGLSCQWVKMFQDLHRSLELGWRLFVRDFSAKYRQSLLGAAFPNALKTYHTCTDPLYSGIALGYLGAFSGLLIHAIGANTFIIVRIMEPFWFLTAIVFLIPGIEKNERGEAPAPA